MNPLSANKNSAEHYKYSEFILFLSTALLIYKERYFFNPLLSQMSYAILYMDSPVGTLRLESEKQGLTKIDFIDNSQETSDAIRKDFLAETKKQLQEYFDGKRKEFDIRLHLIGTPFQQKVWNTLLEIPYGKTWSYEDLAKNLGDTKVIRAAASANGKNPIPILVPCHRVIGKNGTLTGYAGGLWRKKHLLDIEQRERQTTLW